MTDRTELREKIAHGIEQFMIDAPEGIDEREWSSTDMADAILALIPDEEAIRKQERERILTYLQDLIELSSKVDEPAIKVRMMDILQSLKESSGECHCNEKESG